MKKQKLKLDKETLRVLENEEAEKIKGAGRPESGNEKDRISPDKKDDNPL